jgi:hypothetical protein
VDTRAGDGIRSHAEPAKSNENPDKLATGVPKALPVPWPPMPADQDLRLIVEAWPVLPKATRAGILALVR